VHDHDHDHSHTHSHDHGQKPTGTTMVGRPREPKKGRRGVSPRFKELVEAHDWKGKTAVDIGCGTGAGTVLVAKLGADALGIDVDAQVLIHATERAEEENASRARFMCADVEMADYADLAGGPLDGVLAHLCFSEEIAKRASRALKPGGLFFIRSFESEMWKESGPSSDFAYTVGEMRKLLASAGFKVKRLEVERRVQTFGSFQEFEKSMLWDGHRRAQWEEGGRLDTLRRSFKGGNRNLTEAFLVVEAQRTGAAKAKPRAKAAAPKPKAPKRKAK
jgi:SAM-dependent methyltransferase